MVNGSFDSSLIDLGTKFKEDLKSGEFNNFLFITYGIEPGLIEWFPKGSDITILTRRQEIEKIINSEYSDKVKTKILDSHAKIYLMWNQKEIRCWLGSFNFTGGGLFSNIEWCSFFTGELEAPLEKSKMEEENFNPNLTDKCEVNQILDFSSSILAKRDPQLTDNLFENSKFPLILLHSDGSNTLKKSIEKIIDDKILKEIVYITPFFSKEGIMNIIPKGINPEDVELKVLTNKPSKRNYDAGNFPRRSKIEELEEKLDNFKLLKRSSKGEGTTLPDGKEIRDGFIHMKFIGVLLESKKGEEEFHSIFTSANLSKKVWKDKFKSIEVGIWNRDPRVNKKIRTFLEKFKFCFSKFDDEDLEEIDKTLKELEVEEEKKEIWLENTFRDLLTLTKNRLKIEKSASLPKIKDLTCSVFFKNLIDKKQEKEEIVFSEGKDCYSGEMKILEEKKNLVIDFIKINFETNLVEPQKRIKQKHTKKYLENIENLKKEWDAVVIDGDPISKFEIPLEYDDSNIKNILLRKTGKSKNSKTIILEKIEKQPHFEDGLIEDKKASIKTIQGIGDVYEIEIKTNSSIKPPFDTLGFYNDCGEKIDFIGFSKKNERIFYYFYPEIQGRELTVKVEKPYKSYLNQETSKIKIPRYNANYKSKQDKIKKIELNHTLSHEKYSHIPEKLNENKFISEKSSLKINAPKKDIGNLKDAELKYYWKEDSLLYNAPQIKSIGQEFKPFNPYSKIYYRGLIQKEHSGRKVNLMTSSRSLKVKKKLIESIDIKMHNFPRELPLDKLDENSLLGFLKLGEENITYDTASGILQKKPDIIVYKNGSKLPTKNFETLNSGRVIFIPIFFRDIGRENSFIFIFKFKNDTSYTSNFAWYLKIKKYKISMNGKEKITIEDKTGGSSLPIKKNENTKEKIELKFNQELSKGESSRIKGELEEKNKIYPIDESFPKKFPIKLKKDSLLVFKSK
ncbi:PLD superfamily nuclease domain containing protein [Methanonatronarchaeum thermophilum]|uniref:PLD superfamily nuclease domain containing protein n=1 Tax=Methanonatronarchaeum thermophilum TaxID=1927129 RepID=A0A1Y3GDC0_9EURY|nr:phospholipase D family protein [Methanonatronarchaeum thermophilum]OUJ18313.1 PLD superfamily nuclease domain containing protein [Methanonatronarchaeum thermophilum]